MSKKLSHISNLKLNTRIKVGSSRLPLRINRTKVRTFRHYPVTRECANKIYKMRIQKIVEKPKKTDKNKILESTYQSLKSAESENVKMSDQEKTDVSTNFLVREEDAEFFSLVRSGAVPFEIIGSGQAYSGCEFKTFVREGFFNNSIQRQNFGVDIFFTLAKGEDPITYLDPVYNIRYLKVGEYVFTKRTGSNIHQISKKKKK